MPIKHSTKTGQFESGGGSGGGGGGKNGGGGKKSGGGGGGKKSGGGSQSGPSWKSKASSSSKLKPKEIDYLDSVAGAGGRKMPGRGSASRPHAEKLIKTGHMKQSGTTVTATAKGKGLVGKS